LFENIYHMTTFLNKKEQVIDFELTPYGKYKFSLGDLRPAYYSFYDHDILYDGHYGDVGDHQTEVQNNIVTRIKETPRLGAQAHFSSSVGNTIKAPNIGKAEFINLTEANYTFMKPIGNNSPFSDYVPAWHLTTMQDSTTFTGVATYATNLAIPTINGDIDVFYNRTHVDGENEEGDEETFTHYDLVQNERLVIDILELNTIFKANGNYDIEVFRAKDGAPENLERLSFIDVTSGAGEQLESQTDPDVFSVTLGGNENMLEETYPVLNEKYVEYFLSIRVDSEISDIIARPGENLYRAGRVNFPDDVCRPS